MKKPNDENGQFEDIYSASEDIRPTGERVPVQQDERTVKDDANDYLYLKTKRTHHHLQTQDESTESADDMQFVMSTRSSRATADIRTITIITTIITTARAAKRR